MVDAHDDLRVTPTERIRHDGSTRVVADAGCTAASLSGFGTCRRRRELQIIPGSAPPICRGTLDIGTGVVLHLKLVDGSDIYISALAVRFITANGIDGQCNLFFNASDRVTLAGDAKHVAETVHKGLRIIHQSPE